MQTKTILKTLGFFIGWVVSLLILPMGLRLMSQPNTIYTVLGIIITLALTASTFILAGKCGWYASDLISEYRDSKKVKQNKQE
jgi:putative effector of murein hydrolase LrgA (UPF0299 family)